MKLSKSLAAVALMVAATAATAETRTGHLQYHNQVIFQTITLTNTDEVSVWTDSYAVGGFDTILALWSADGSLVDLSDDTAILPEMGIRDAGIFRLVLGPGEYTIGLSPYSNFPNGTLGQGYWYDNDVPQALPNASCDATCSFYRLHWTVGNTAPVPEPSSYAMLLAGLGAVGFAARRRARRGA